MANPLWIPGSPSANPSGRPKHSIRTVKGMVSNFILRNISPCKLQRMFNALTEKDRLEMLLQLMPYVAPKMAADSISSADVDLLYSRVMEAINNTTNAKTG